MTNLKIGEITPGDIDSADPHKLRHLTQALIKFCMQDGDRASQELSVRLSNLQSQISTIELKLDSDLGIDEVKVNLEIAMSEILQSFIELQFFDRISQRMDHAIQSVQAGEMDDAAQAGVANIFTMEDERILYDALLEGESVDSAVQKANAKLISVVKDVDDDIELF